jgi:hypothetical protein
LQLAHSFQIRGRQHGRAGRRNKLGLIIAVKERSVTNVINTLS